jgi:hypothetical protein
MSIPARGDEATAGVDIALSVLAYLAGVATERHALGGTGQSKVGAAEVRGVLAGVASSMSGRSGDQPPGPCKPFHRTLVGDFDPCDA